MPAAATLLAASLVLFGFAAAMLAADLFLGRRIVALLDEVRSAMAANREVLERIEAAADDDGDEWKS
jgi:hypothetical protein